MIQRIQSLWLLLSAGSIILLGKLPIYLVDLANGQSQNLMTGERFFTTIIALLLLIFSLVTIFLFKNRTLQKKLVWLHILLNVLLLFLFWVVKDSFLQSREVAVNASHYGLGIAAPLLSIIFDIMAYRGIVADEKLIKASDRFR